MEIRDMLGRKLGEVLYDAGKTFDIDLNNYAAGTYTLSFKDKTGKRWYVKVIRE